MHLIAGLGNPGSRYARNRHNIGFMVADELVHRAAASFGEKFRGEQAKVRLLGGDAVVLKPLTYMNLSGDSVQRAMHFFKLDLGALVVIHDELDLAFGMVRVKSGGGTAGHKGLKSISQRCGGTGFVRIRVGIGRPEGSQSVEDYVLNDFDAVERAQLSDVIALAADAAEAVLAKGVTDAMNQFNARAR